MAGFNGDVQIECQHHVMNPILLSLISLKSECSSLAVVASYQKSNHLPTRAMTAWMFQGEGFVLEMKFSPF